MQHSLSYDLCLYFTNCKVWCVSEKNIDKYVTVIMQEKKNLLNLRIKRIYNSHNGSLGNQKPNERIGSAGQTQYLFAYKYSSSPMISRSVSQDKRIKRPQVADSKYLYSDSFNRARAYATVPLLRGDTPVIEGYRDVSYTAVDVYCKRINLHVFYIFSKWKMFLVFFHW